MREATYKQYLELTTPDERFWDAKAHGDYISRALASGEHATEHIAKWYASIYYPISPLDFAVLREHRKQREIGRVIPGYFTSELHDDDPKLKELRDRWLVRRTTP